jgi:hypothetical protein
VRRGKNGDALYSGPSGYLEFFRVTRIVYFNFSFFTASREALSAIFTSPANLIAQETFFRKYGKQGTERAHPVAPDSPLAEKRARDDQSEHHQSAQHNRIHSCGFSGGGAQYISYP